jgi:Na+/melibiose symporter-like transporter
LGDYGRVSSARKVAAVVGPIVVIVAGTVFGILLTRQDRSAVANWVAIAGLVVAAIALIVTWLTWVRPMSPSGAPSPPANEEPSVNKVKGDKSFGSATNSQILYGNRNRLGEGKKR